LRKQQATQQQKSISWRDECLPPETQQTVRPAVHQLGKIHEAAPSHRQNWAIFSMEGGMEIPRKLRDWIK